MFFANLHVDIYEKDVDDVSLEELFHVDGNVFPEHMFPNTWLKQEDDMMK